MSLTSSPRVAAFLACILLPGALGLLLCSSGCSKKEPQSKPDSTLHQDQAPSPAEAAHALASAASENSKSQPTSNSARPEAILDESNEEQTSSSFASPPKLSRREIERLHGALAIDADNIRGGIVERYALQSLEDPKLEIAYLLSKYESGDNSVAIDLALLLAHIGKTPEQIDQAKTILELAAENGEARAYAELARIVLLSDASQIDPHQAIVYLENSVAAHDPEGTYLLGVANRLNLMPGANLETGTELLETAAELGHPQAAIALFRNLQNTEIFGTDSSTESNITARELLANYPNMENWLVHATTLGHPSHFDALADFYSETGRGEHAKETRLQAAQLGSYDALSYLIRSNSMPMRQQEDRENIKGLLSIHLDNDHSTTATKAEAHLLLASIIQFDRYNPENSSLVKKHLQQSLELGNFRAGVTLLRIQQGTDHFSAFAESFSYENSEQTYSRYLELKREIQVAANPKRDLPPYPSYVAPAEYPAELNSENLSGEVVVSVTIDSDGSIRNPEIFKSTHPSFESYALESVLKYKFEPALKNGKPIPTRVRIPIRFIPVD